jgi:hypothetical protein
MARVTPESASITDLANETMTEINFQKKTYTVMTFVQWKELMQKASRQTQTGTTYKASVKETGQTREISGLSAKEAIMTLEMETADEKTGKTSTMVITSDMWLAPKVAGYEEVQNFHKRMAEKLGLMPSGNPFMQRSDIAKAMADVAKESAALNGVPVMSVTKMGMKGDFGPEAAGAQSSDQPQQAPPPPQQTAQQAPPQSPSASDTIGGKLGRIGGLGGFGRKKPKDDQQNQPPQQQQQPQSSQQASGNQKAEPGLLMETSTEFSGFSAAAVDGSKLEVPAGFKKIDPKK